MELAVFQRLEPERSHSQRSGDVQDVQPGRGPLSDSWQVFAPTDRSSRRSLAPALARREATSKCCFAERSRTGLTSSKGAPVREKMTTRPNASSMDTPVPRAECNAWSLREDRGGGDGNREYRIGNANREYSEYSLSHVPYRYSLFAASSLGSCRGRGRHQWDRGRS